MAAIFPGLALADPAKKVITGMARPPCEDCRPVTAGISFASVK
jgi:hypothetical protein